MKRYLSLLLVLVLLFLTSCGGTTAGESSGPSSSAPSSSAPVSSVPSSSQEESSSQPSSQSSQASVPASSAVVVTQPVITPGETYTGLPSLGPITFTVKDPNNTAGLSTAKNSFSFGVAKNGQPHQITVDNQARFDSYGTNALAWDNKSGEKVLYLTFDCGYAYEDLTLRILDTLKEKNVPATFFVTMHYLKTAPGEATRMINEGHIIGNHSTTHPADSSVLSRTQLAEELLGVHNYLRANFGYVSEYFRFPSGVYSQNALDLVNSVGYKSVFWSIAHTDWDPANQPGEDVSFNTLTSRLHPGAVILLHSTSPDNAAILGEFIDYCRAQGYTFKSLDEYNYWN